MFRVLPITLFLTLILASISNAGLDFAGIPGIPHPTKIVLYHFESAEEEDDLTFTIDEGFWQSHGVLFDEATIVEDGKYGNCLELEKQGWLAAIVSDVPALTQSEFSFTVWIKFTEPANELYFALSGRDADNETISGISVIIMSSGNFRAVYRHAVDDLFTGVETEDQNIFDAEWHHIVFTKLITTYTLYLDGEPVAEAFGEPEPKIEGERAVFYVSDLSDDDLNGKVLIDDLGYFQTGFSPYDVKGLYNDGLADFLEIMSVNPQDRLTTTWGKLKTQ
jgi:hypothetical protein